MGILSRLKEDIARGREEAERKREILTAIRTVNIEEMDANLIDKILTAFEEDIRLAGDRRLTEAPPTMFIELHQALATKGKVGKSLLEAITTEVLGQRSNYELYERAEWSYETTAYLYKNAGNISNFKKCMEKASDCCIKLAEGYAANGKYIDSGDCYRRAADSYKIYRELKNELKFKENVKRSAQCYLNALKKESQSLKMAEIHEKIAYNYAKLGDKNNYNLHREMAYECYLRAVEECERAGDYSGAAKSCKEIARHFEKMNDTKGFRLWISKAVPFFLTEAKTMEGKGKGCAAGINYSLIAECYRILNQPNEEQTCLEKAIQQYVAEGDYIQEYAGECYERLNQIDRAIGAYLTAAMYYERKGDDFLARAVYEKAIQCYKKLNKINEASQYIEKVNRYYFQEIEEERGKKCINWYDYVVIANNCISIARNYLLLGDNENFKKYGEEALQYFSMAATKAEQDDDFDGSVNTCVSAGDWCKVMGQHSEATAYWYKAIHNFEKRRPDIKEELISIFLNVAKTYEKLGEYEKALEELHKILSINERSSTIFSELLIEKIRGKIALQNNNVKSAKEHFELAFELFEKHREVFIGAHTIVGELSEEDIAETKNLLSKIKEAK